MQDISLTPLRFSHLHQTPMQHKAVGIPAIVSSFKQMLQLHTPLIVEKGGLAAPFRSITDD